MASHASAFIVGRLSRDPDTRQTTGGKAICSFAVAVNRKTRTEEEVSFFDIEAWDKTAELCQKFLAKGRNVMVAGRLKQDNWVDKTTQQKRSKIKIVANEVQFLDSKPAEGAAPASEEMPRDVSRTVTLGNADEDLPPF